MSCSLYYYNVRHWGWVLRDKIVADQLHPALLLWTEKAPYLKLNLFQLSDEKVGWNVIIWFQWQFVMSIIVQQDATIYSFIIFSADTSTCFRWYPHLSSGAHSNCNYNIWHWSNRICYRQWTVTNTVRPVPDVVITVWMCSWWWMKGVIRNIQSHLQKI